MKTIVLSPNLVIEVSRTLVRAEASKADFRCLQVEVGNKNEFLYWAEIKGISEKV